MKKLFGSIAWLCAAVLIFQSAALPVLAEDAEDVPAETAAQSTPVSGPELNLLQALELLPVGATFYQGQPMTRGQMAYITARMAGYQPSEVTDVPVFVDMDAASEYCGAVNYLAAAGMISGDNGRFRPEDGITYDEAASLAVKALGYATLAAERYGAYPGNVRRMAQRLSLFDGVSGYSYEDAVPAENALIVLANLTKAPMAVGIAWTDDDVVLTMDDQDTLLSENYGIRYHRGVMTDNGITALDRLTRVRRGGAVIGDVTLEARAEGLDVDEYIGEAVEFWYHENQKTLIYACEDVSRNSVLTLPYRDVAADAAGFDITNIIYYTNGGRALKTARLDIDANTIYNGAADPYMGLEDLKIDSGYMKLVDTDNDNRYDVVKVTEYTDAVISSVGNGNELYFPGITVSMDEWDNVTVVDADGLAVETDALAAGSVVSMVMSKNKVSIRLIDQSAKTLSGTVTALQRPAGEAPVLTVAGAEYQLSRSYAAEIAAGAKTMPSMGSLYTFHLNADGDIFGTQEANAVDGGWYTGYCVGIRAKDEGFEASQLYARIVMTNGSEFVPQFKQKITLDGTRGVTAQEVLKSDSLFPIGTDGVRHPKRQPIRFRLDDWGMVAEIDTPTDITGEDYPLDTEEFSLDYYSKSAAFKPDSVMAVAGSYLVSGSTTIFQDPWLGEADADYEIEDVVVLPRNALSTISTLTECSLYDLDASLQVGTLVFKPGGTASGSWEQSILTIGSVYTQINEEGILEDVIEGVAFGQSVTYRPYDDSVSFAGLKEGDVCKYSVLNNKLRSLQKITSLDEVMESRYFEDANGIENSEWSMIYAPVFSVSSAGISVVAPEMPTGDGKSYKLIGNSFNSNATRVTVYDVRSHTVRPGSLGELWTNLAPDAKGNAVVNDSTPRVLIYRRLGYAREPVFITY